MFCQQNRTMLVADFVHCWLRQEAITEQRFPEYARDMVACSYPDGDVPEWITLGLELAGISL
jgi:hypothetical protein